MCTIAIWPLLCTPRKLCGWLAAITASIATRTLPSVLFLKPIAAEKPEASSRCTWLSVVRAPIAPQLSRSAMYCGLDVSSSSLPAGTPIALMSISSDARDAQAFVDAKAAVQVRVVDEALPADRGARLLEVHAHHDLERVVVRLARLDQMVGVFQRRTRLVHRARPDHHQQPVVGAVHDAPHAVAAGGDEAFDRPAGHRKKADQLLRRRQRLDRDDTFVVDLAGLFGGVGGAHAADG